MDILLLTILVLLLGVAVAILYLNLRSKPKDENENKEAEEMANLKTEITSLKDVDIEPSEVLIVAFTLSFNLTISAFKLAISSASLFSFSPFVLDLKFR